MSSVFLYAGRVRSAIAQEGKLLSKGTTSWKALGAYKIYGVNGQ